MVGLSLGAARRAVILPVCLTKTEVNPIIMAIRSSVGEPPRARAPVYLEPRCSDYGKCEPNDFGYDFRIDVVKTLLLFDGAFRECNIGFAV
jgi:hypothetical protein